MTLEPLFFEVDDTATATTPLHYRHGSIECIEAIKAALGRDGFAFYLQGNCLKYLWRFRYKSGVEDLKKAEVYLGWLIKELEPITTEKD